jgi:two-component system, NtrC family, response regulator AtoC
MSTTKTASTDTRDDATGAVLLVAGGGELTTFSLVRDEIVIGRDADCDVVVADAALSRRHARLRLGPPLTVEDLGSKNGVKLLRRQLPPNVPTPLSIGEAFRIGKISFIVVRSSRARQSSSQHGFEALVVSNPTVAGATSLVRDIAQAGINALILGETGVGKEVLAETLHALSHRKGSFVRINCAAISPALLESELFGHDKGAFTGAAQGRAGLLEAAQGGTVLLDEVGDLPSDAQAKLLRAIETREVTRVGAVRPIPIDVRFIAATNRDLAQEVAAGRFRSDLYFRIDGVTLRIPPLRERRDQIASLAVQFLKAPAAKKLPQLSPTVLEHLRSYDWPGNVRELKMALERALLLSRGGELTTRHLAFSPPAREPIPATAIGMSADEAEERRRIIAALEACNGNQTRAASRLGISRSTLVTKLSVYRIPRPRK